MSKLVDMHPALEAALNELKRARLELEAVVRRELGEPELGPLTRGLVVLDPLLAELRSHLQDRNMLTIMAKTSDFSPDLRDGLLAMRVLITLDEAPHVGDASSYCYGILSLRVLGERDPAKVAEVISDAMMRRHLWDRRHGWLLVLRDDGGDEYTPLVD